MYQAYLQKYAWADGCQFFTFSSKERCSEFKTQLGKANLVRFTNTPVFGDALGDRSKFALRDCSWGYTLYALTISAGSTRQVNGTYGENPVRGMPNRYWLRIRAPELEEDAPVWRSMIATYNQSPRQSFWGNCKKPEKTARGPRDPCAVA